MFVFVRAAAYATLFVGFVLVYLPAQILSWFGISRPPNIGLAQGAGMILGVVGAALALACVLTFVFVGRGTPAPFDPPRRLVVRGPYGLVRNPMYLGAGIALAGAALFYESTALFVFSGMFLLVTHLFVVWYEEPTLRRMFGDEYEVYSRRVERWWPRFESRRRVA